MHPFRLGLAVSGTGRRSALHRIRATHAGRPYAESSI